MIFLKPPELVEKIENKKFLFFKRKRKVWYIKWEYCAIGPYYHKHEAIAELSAALATLETYEA